MVLAGCSTPPPGEPAGSGAVSSSTTSSSGSPTGSSSSSSAASAVPTVVFELDDSVDQLILGPQTSAQADWVRIQVRVASAQLYTDVYVGEKEKRDNGQYYNEKAQMVGAYLSLDGTAVNVTEKPAPMVVRGTGDANESDFLQFCSDSQAQGVAIEVIDRPTGTVLGKYTFASIHVCPNYYG